jgi:hypothetical protein
MAVPGHFFGLFPCSGRGLWGTPHLRPTRGRPERKSPALLPGPGIFATEMGGDLCRLLLHHRILVLAFALGGLGTATRAFGQSGFDLLDRFGLGDALHH